MLNMDQLIEIFSKDIFLVKTYTEEEPVYLLDEINKSITKTAVIRRSLIDIMSKVDIDNLNDGWEITRKGNFPMMYLPYFYTLCKTTTEVIH